MQTKECKDRHKGKVRQLPGPNEGVGEKKSFKTNQTKEKDIMRKEGTIQTLNSLLVKKGKFSVRNLVEKMPDTGLQWKMH